MGGVRRKDGQRRSDVGKGIDFRKKIGAALLLFSFLPAKKDEELGVLGF